MSASFPCPPVDSGAVAPVDLPIVMVDDDPSVLLSAATVLRGARLEPVITLSDSRELLPLLEKQGAAMIILDLAMPYISGMQLLPEIVLRFPETPILVMTATDDVQTAVTCIKEGATDFLVKPVEENRFVTSVRKVLEVRSLRKQVGALKRSLLSDRLEQEDAFRAIITTSRKMRAVFQYMESIATSEEPVLITGETGVGKELIAAALAQISKRKGPMVAVNVAGLDDVMVSDTLFGHRKGAYSGAEDNRRGLVSEAGFGTLFLDEIGDLGASTQVKLLRLLQERKYYPLGSDLPLKSNARIFCATNQFLHQRMLEGRFRTDLYYRLLVHHVEVPPLRERLEDVSLLTHHFLEEAACSLGKPVPTPPPELFTLLESYHFPGNVRQLRALVYDAVARHRSGILSMESFRSVLGSSTKKTGRVAWPASTSGGKVASDLFENGYTPHLTMSNLLRGLKGGLPTLKEIERCLVLEAMHRSRGNQGIAAGFLGISRQALNQRLRKEPFDV